MSSLFEGPQAALDEAPLVAVQGVVDEVRGMALHAVDLPVEVGASVEIRRRGGGGVSLGEVVGFNGRQTIVLPYANCTGVRRGDVVRTRLGASRAQVGPELLGRVINALGEPIDGLGPVRTSASTPMQPPPVDPLNRPLIDAPLGTGVRAIDAMLSAGRGQRLGIFAPAGVGKSTLIGMMARHTAADVSVVALVGERGREVRDFIEHSLGPEGLSRSVVVCATGDESALLRIRAALYATSVAEYFRDQGANVLLMMDSVTRFCQAQRQVGLAAGEPPATKGYPPSVFAMLPVLLERSGRTAAGTITGFYTVLMEGDELTDPITEAARGVLDGHVMLDRDLASRGHWPAINVLRSISRVANDVTTKPHQAAQQQVLRLLEAYRKVEDLIDIGAYTPGSNPDADVAIACKPVLDQFLQQARGEQSAGDPFVSASQQLGALVHQIERTRLQVQETVQRAAAPAQVSRR